MRKSLMVMIAGIFGWIYCLNLSAVQADFISTPSEQGSPSFHEHLVRPGTLTSYIIETVAKSSFFSLLPYLVSNFFIKSLPSQVPSLQIFLFSLTFSPPRAYFPSPEHNYLLKPSPTSPHQKLTSPSASNSPQSPSKIPANEPILIY